MGKLVDKHGEIIPREKRELITKRYKTITYAINKEFWNINSDTQNSIFVGSYGRGTAITTSDIDILVCIPRNEYERFDALKGNGQSRLLQAVRTAILDTYPRSDVRADGQVVKITFTDGIKFEVLPAFKNINIFGEWDGTYIYPDSNMGGNWCSTNPKAEQNAVNEKNKSSNGLLKDTCKHMRQIRDNAFSSYHLSGIAIDSFVYSAMGNWKWSDPGSTGSAEKGKYERVLYDYYLLNCNNQYASLRAPGSGEIVSLKSSYECLGKVLKAMQND